MEKKKEKAHMYYFFSTTFLGGHGVGVRVWEIHKV